MGFDPCLTRGSNDIPSSGGDLPSRGGICCHDSPSVWTLANCGLAAPLSLRERVRVRETVAPGATAGLSRSAEPPMSDGLMMNTPGATAGLSSSAEPPMCVTLLDK